MDVAFCKMALLLGPSAMDVSADCYVSDFLRAPMQSQRRNKEEKDNHYPDIREKVQSQCAQFFFVQVKAFHEPRSIGVPQNQSGNPIEHSEKYSNHKGAQEKVSKDNNLFAFHDPSAISDQAIDVRLFFHRTL
jgi:hypothetical protein